MNKIKREAEKNLDEEIIGVLIGKVSGHTLIVEEAVTGEFEPEATRVTLPSRTIAKVSDRILKGELKGNIVGWYHSHPGYGVFMSETDIESQRKLQQFSSEVIALVIDPTSSEVGFFTLDLQGNVCIISEEFVNFYRPGEPPIPEKFAKPPQVEMPRQRQIPVPVRHPVPEPVSRLPLLIPYKDTTTLKVAAVALATMAAVIIIIIFISSIPDEGMASRITDIQTEIKEAQLLGVSVSRAQDELQAAQDSLEEQKTREAREYIERAYIEFQLSLIQWKIEEIERIPCEHEKDIPTAKELLAKTKVTFQDDKYPYDKTRGDLDYNMQFVDARLLTIAAEYYVEQAKPLIGDFTDINQKVEAAKSSFESKNYDSAIRQAGGALEQVTEKLLPKVEDDISTASRDWLNPKVSNEALQRAQQFKDLGACWKAIEEALNAELELQYMISDWMNDRARTNMIFAEDDFSTYSSQLIQARQKHSSEAFKAMIVVQEDILREANDRISSNISVSNQNSLQINIAEAESLLKSADKEENLQERMEILLLANTSFQIQLAYRCIDMAQDFGVADIQSAINKIERVKGEFKSSNYSNETSFLTGAREAQKLALEAALDQLTKQVDAAEIEGKDVKRISPGLIGARNSINTGDYLDALKKLLEAKKNYDTLMSEESTEDTGGD